MYQITYTNSYQLPMGYGLWTTAVKAFRNEKEKDE